MEASREEYRRILLDVFRSFSALCDREGLHWVLAFGSAIGAVRHGGMIPWDDDIDVFMPRKDYDRFLGLTAPQGYRILSIDTSPLDLPFAFAKYMDTGSTIVEQKRYPVPIGVFVDVFPLDESGPEPEKIRQEYSGAFLRYVRSFRRHSFGEWCGDLFHGRFHEAGAAVQDLLWFRPRKKTLRAKFLSISAKAASQQPSGTYSIWSTNSDYNKLLFPREWFEGIRLVPFEGMQAPVPGGNDKLLTMIYGDYMTPPPEEGRVSVHHHWFVDLGKPLEI